MVITELIYNAQTGKSEYITRELTQEEVDKQAKQQTEAQRQSRIAEIKTKLNNLSEDFIQADLGAVFNDLEERKAQFITLHNELRELLGKEPRIYTN